MATVKRRYDGRNEFAAAAVIADRVVDLPNREHVVRKAQERVAAAAAAKRPAKARDKAIVAMYGETDIR